MEDIHPVEELIALAQKEERERCIKALTRYWDSIEYVEDLSLEGAIASITK